MTKKENDLSNLLSIYQAKLTEQRNDFDALDNKLNFFLIFPTSLLIASFEFLFKDFKLFNLFFVLLVGSLTFTIINLFPKKLHSGLFHKEVLDNNWKESNDLDVDGSEHQILVDFCDAIEKNKSVLACKASLSRHAIYAFSGSLFFIVFEYLIKLTLC